MSLSVTDSSAEPQSFSQGPIKFQVVQYSFASGDTSGTLTADNLYKLFHLVADGYLNHTAAPTYSSNAATLAVSVPTSTAAALTLGGVTYTAVATDNSGNLISVAYTGGATAGAEVVTVVGKAISVQIENGVSSITQVRTAVNLSAPAALLVTATGTSATAVSTASAQFLSGGITGGARGTVLCMGI